MALRTRVFSVYSGNEEAHPGPHEPFCSSTDPSNIACACLFEFFTKLDLKTCKSQEGYKKGGQKNFKEVRKEELEELGQVLTSVQGKHQSVPREFNNGCKMNYQLSLINAYPTAKVHSIS